jgi:PD-(D/E)XK nuclease family transposase
MAAPGIDPKIDYVFKRLFGDEGRARLLIDLLNAVLDLPPGRPSDGRVANAEPSEETAHITAVTSVPRSVCQAGSPLSSQ